MRYITLICFAALLFQCGNVKLIREAKRETSKMHWDRSYQLWEQVYRENPNDTRAKIQMERAGMYAALRHLEEGLILLGHNSFAEARAELEFALKYDPDNQEAIDALERLERAKKEIEEQVRQAEEQKDEEVLSFYPQLQPSTWEPLNLYFPRPTKVRDIYQALGKNYGINILMEGKVKGDIPYLDLRNLDFIKALDTLMILNRHFFKVIDEKTLVIFTDQRDTRERYSNQVIKTYYLSNTTPKELTKHLKLLGGDLKNFSENEELNAITLKGTPEQIAIADRIIAANDKAKAEVIVEVELLEVNKNDLREMGIQPVFFNPSDPTSTTPMYQAGVYFRPDGEDSSQIRGIFPSISSDDFFTVLPSVMLKLLKENSDSKQIFNPHVRVTAGKEAQIQIGSSVPTASTAFVNPYQSSGSNDNIGDRALTTFNYKDAGIKIAVTPRVHHNYEITLELALEVTSIIGTQDYQPIFGKRIVDTTIRLKNGESSVLAGLLSNDERQSLTGFPGLSEIPILKHLFSSESKVVNQTDIVLLLRPMIVRGANITPEDTAPYEISTLSLSKLYSGGRPTETPKEMPQTRSMESSKSSPSNQSSEDGEDEAEVEPDQEYRTEQQGQSGMNHEPTRSSDSEELEVYDEPVSDESNDVSPAVMAFMPASNQVRVDGKAQVKLFMTNVSDLFKGEVVLSFDPEFLQIEDLQLQNLPMEQGRSPKLTPFWDQENGKASVIITPIPGSKAFSGSGILTNLVLRGLKPGTTKIEVSQIECSNEEGQTLPFQALSGTVVVTP